MTNPKLIPVECDLPEGWEPVTFRLPKNGEFYCCVRGNKVVQAMFDFKESLRLIIRRIPAPHEPAPFDPNKPYRQRCGRPAVIHTNGSKVPWYPLAGEHLNANGEWEQIGWESDGSMGFPAESQFDLVNYTPEPETTTVWANIYPENVCTHGSRATADRDRDAKACIACVPVTYHKGQGLE